MAADSRQVYFDGWPRVELGRGVYCTQKHHQEGEGHNEAKRADMCLRPAGSGELPGIVDLSPSPTLELGWH